MTCEAPPIVDADGNQLQVYTDGEVVITFADGSEAVESFEDGGKEMTLEFDSAQLVEDITFRQTAAKITRGNDE
jgi:hypothetical protein